MQNMLSSGKTLYVDDLVTDAAARSQGHGEAMLQWLIALAREAAAIPSAWTRARSGRRRMRFIFGSG